MWIRIVIPMFDFIRYLFKNYGMFYYRLISLILLARFFPQIYHVVFKKELVRVDIIIGEMSFDLFDYIVSVSIAILLAFFILHFSSYIQQPMNLSDLNGMNG